MLLGTLGANLLGNILAGKGINKKGQGMIRAGEGTVRTAYGYKKGQRNNKKDF